MTHRQRIFATLNHQRPDRIPAVLAARPEVDRDLMHHFGVHSINEVHHILGTDGWAGVGIGIDFSDFEKKVNGELTGDCPYADHAYIFHDESTFEDAWGVVRRKGRDGKYVEWISGPLVHAADPDDYDFPQIDRLIPDAQLSQRVQQLKSEDNFVASGVTMPFKTAWELRGMENLLADYLLNPAFVEKLYDKIYALYGEILLRTTVAGVDMIGIGGDIAMQDRLIMGPALWRQIDKPRLRNLIARCKAVNPDVHVKIHSDGNLWEIMDDLIEIGFDVIDPIQPECMNPVEVKQLFGDLIVLHGCGSVQRTLPFGTVDDVRNEVIQLIEKCGYNGGLVLRASNAISFDTPVENVLAFFETARDYRLA
ncbi:hypothetical protein JXJ21_25375 [candidate division KSB1 bacterium]|nr:hypothetical protein [candidate division KSB1 bacterium]